jgi:transcriptional regulator with XRE-family HTH domain
VKTQSRNPLAISALRRVMGEHGWNQEDLAKRSKLHRSVVSMQLSGNRAIRDEHLPNYLLALSKTERTDFAAAWLRDLVPAGARQDLLADAGDFAPEVQSWAPTLSDQDRQTLSWLAGAMAEDPQLAALIRALCERFGFR